MVDLGLLLSMVAVIGFPAAFARWRPLSTGGEARITDVAAGPLFVGLLMGRVVHLALDDPNSLTRLRDFTLVRSGVEFWAGAAAGIAVVAIRAGREGVAVAPRLADLAPAALIAQAGYHLTCFVRDGCYGPRWWLGPTPKGLSHGMLPVEPIAAVGLVLVAIVITDALAPFTTIFVAATAIAVERSITSFWLPRIGDGLTRQHVTSMVVAGVGVVGAGLAGPLERRRSPSGAVER